MAYMRYPGRILAHEETPPTEVLGFIAGQLGITPKVFQQYAERGETRREHNVLFWENSAMPPTGHFPIFRFQN